MSIYFIREDQPTGGRIKIGYSGADPRQRRDALQTGNPTKLCLLSVIPGSMLDEANLHKQFAALRLAGEWFAPGPDLLRLIDDGPRADDGSMPINDLRLVWIVRGGAADVIREAPAASRIAQFALLIHLAEMADTAGAVPPISSVALGARAMMSERTARRTLDALHGAGLVTIDPVLGALSCMVLTRRTMPPVWFTPLCRETRVAAGAA